MLDSAVGSRNGVKFIEEADLVTTGLTDEALRFANKSRYIESEANLLRALTVTPDVDALLYNLAVVLQMQGRNEEAIELLLPLVQKEPESIQYQAELANAYSGARLFDDAIIAYKEAFRFAVKYESAAKAADIARSLAVTFFAAGREQEALCYSYEAQTLRETPDEYEKNLRFMLFANVPSAVLTSSEDMQKIHKDWNNRCAVKYYVALAAYAVKDMEKAESAIQDAKDLQRQNPELQSEIAAAWAVITNAGEKIKVGEIESVDKALAENKRLAAEILDNDLRVNKFWPASALRKLKELESVLVVEGE